jgi:tetratricopeptide (TPR) repeat protein
MALAADCYGMLVLQGWTDSPATDAEEGLRLAIRAAELAQDDANVLWMSAWTMLRLGKDRERTAEFARKSIELNPNSAMAALTAGHVEAMSGNASKAFELLQRAQRLSPRDPRAWLMAASMAVAYFVDRQYEEAAAFANRALMQNPRFTGSIRILASSLALLRKRDKAAQVIQRQLQLDPQITLKKLRVRLSFMHDGVWDRFAEGLRLAGMSD